MVGDNIRAFRIKKGWTQEQLANDIGVKRAVISKYETGAIEPSSKQLRFIADALDVSFFDLLSDNEGKWFKDGVDRGFLAGHYQTKSGIEESLRDDGYSLSEVEKRLVQAFSSLNEEGQQKAVEQVSDLAKIPDYQKPKTPK